MHNPIKQHQAELLLSRRVPIIPERKTFFNASGLEDVRKHLLNHHQDLLQRSLFERISRIAVEKAIREYLTKSGYVGKVLDEKTSAYTEEICGLGPIDKLFFDPSVTDIMVNRYDDIRVMRLGERHGERVSLTFENEKHVYRIANKIANASGQQLSLTNPMPICYLPGARVSIVIPPISQTGTTITIRKYSKDLISFEDMIQQGMINQEAVHYLKNAMEKRLNIVICGPVGAGKTTFLRDLFQFVPDNERVLVIENIPELRLNEYYPQKHVVSYITRASFNRESDLDIDMLFERSLSQNMRWFVFGEIRGKEAMTVIEALNTGHKGLTTMHANSAEDAVERMIMMCLRTERDISPEYTGKMIANTLDLVVHMEDLHVMEISEVLDYVDGRPLLRPMFQRTSKGLVKVGSSANQERGHLILENKPMMHFDARV